MVQSTLLESLLALIKDDKNILINLYNENDLLLITFNLAGYASLKDELLAREVKTLYLNSKTAGVDITLNVPAN